MIPLALEFMIPNRLWALAIIPVIAVLYVVLSGRTVHRPMSSRLRLVVPRDAAWKRHGAVLLVGDPEYYERFGFFADKAQHFVMPGPFERRRFLALELKDGWLDGAAGVLVASGRRRVMTDLRKAA